MASSSRKRSADTSWQRFNNTKTARLAHEPPSRLLSVSPQRRGSSSSSVAQRASTSSRRLPLPSPSQNPPMPIPRNLRVPIPRASPVSLPRLPPEVARQRVQPVAPPQPLPYKPAIRHPPHPESKLCQDFHWVPYPLGLMPYDSWNTLHGPKQPDVQSPFRCPVCRQKRKTTAHKRKVFLVAERLTWEEGTVSMRDKEQNQELTWEVNYELGILDPCIEDTEHFPGGKNSQSNKWHPYQNEYEMKQALNLIFLSDSITQVSWSLWIGVHLDLEKLFGTNKEQLKHQTSHRDASSASKSSLASKTGDGSLKKAPKAIAEIDLTVSPDRASRNGSTCARPNFSMPTPPSSSLEESGTIKVADREAASRQPAPLQPVAGFCSPSSYFNDTRHITSYKTLQDFYSLLDQIERTSYVGAMFLEAYAENLRDDMCKDCWLKHNVKLGEY